MFSKTLFLDITRLYSLLISENTSNFYQWKAKKTSKTQQLISIHTEVNIDTLTFGLNFHLNNRQLKATTPCPSVQITMQNGLQMTKEKLLGFLKLTYDTTVTCTRDRWNVTYKETFDTDRSLSPRHLISANA